MRGMEMCPDVWLCVCVYMRVCACAVFAKRLVRLGRCVEEGGRYECVYLWFGSKTVSACMCLSMHRYLYICLY